MARYKDGASQLTFHRRDADEAMSRDEGGLETGFSVFGMESGAAPALTARSVAQRSR